MWVTVSMGVFALILSVVWSTLWNQSVTEYLPFVLAGLLPWVMFNTCLSEACTAFIGAKALIESRQFPYTMLINVVLGRNTIIFLHNLLIYILVVFFCGVTINQFTLLVPLGFLVLLVNLGWIGLVIATLCLRFRDFQQLIALILQISMFITPIFWPAGQISGRKVWLVDANIIYHLIDVVRSPLLGKSPAVISYMICIVSAAVGWWFAIWLYGRKRHRLVYWL